MASKKYFDKEALFYSNVVWLHVNNCCKEAVVHSYQEEAITGIMFCHQTGGHITGWAYNRDLRGGGGGGVIQKNTDNTNGNGFRNSNISK